MKLYGTVTSPFVRRVRILALELGEPVGFVDINTDDGKAALAAVTPLAKFPVAELDGRLWLDSRVISEELVAARGHGPLRRSRPEDRNVLTVADGALDAAINWFYLVRRDGGDPNQPYLLKQAARVDAALDWLGARLVGGSFAPEGGLGLPEIALATALEWMIFRDVRPIAANPALGGFVAAWKDRASFVATRPH